MKQVYIACALTHVPRPEFESYVTLIHRLAKAAGELNWAPKYALVDSDPQLSSHDSADRARLCYLWDRQMVGDSSLVVAEATFPSIGLGIELQIAEARDIPIVLLYRSNDEYRADPIEYLNPDAKRHTLQIGEGYVTLMALGLPSVLAVHGYRDPEEALGFVRAAIRRLTP